MAEDIHKQKTLYPNISKASAPLEVPKIIGPYKIESLLEKGGMSILYLGTNPETKEPVTIKVLSPKFLSHPEVVQRFLNEAEIIAMADHPNIVKMHGHGEWEGGLYIAMEFIQGISLRQYILQTPMSLKKALEIIIDIAYALCHLHTHGVIHRDLKPENILVTESGVIKVIDFGIAQLLAEKIGSDSSRKQGLIGTPIYMSPEQRENPESVSYPSDIYSLGIISYELILGKLSHGQIHLSLMPKGIQKILNKSLLPNPKDRYQDIVDFISDVSAYLNSANLQKEKNVGDYISEMSENLRQAQMILIPPQAPNWPETEVGFASNKGIGIVGGIYCDFLDVCGGNYGIMIGEPKIKGAEGLVFTAVLRGMARALSRLTANPVEMATILNDLLIQDNMGQIVTLSYLVLNPGENKWHFLSCDYGPLWSIPSGQNIPVKVTTDNVALGFNDQHIFTEVVKPWNPGDNLIVTSLASIFINKGKENDFNEDALNKILEEYAKISPQKQVDGILRKAKLFSSKEFYSQPATLISIKRVKS
jgi:eukaryotic-like serine/threonine-protein kinase